jgi:flagellar hook assembly protein FlgD
MVVISTKKNLGLSIAPYSLLPSYGDFTRINFTLPSSANVTAKIYTLSGTLVYTLLDNVNKPAGTTLLTWKGRDANNKVVPKGEYVLEVEAAMSDETTITRQGNISIR